MCIPHLVDRSDTACSLKAPPWLNSSPCPTEELARRDDTSSDEYVHRELVTTRLTDRRNSSKDTTIIGSTTPAKTGSRHETARPAD
ncbi:unnamed protein product, partial [Nippostrongylus brasiliensis]|uniref:Uncharacterized protein n=1 Tax=Nippostrongylus brasiliensis TaxID=27835 RepID=A0A0N4XLN0_NIPBR